MKVNIGPYRNKIICNLYNWYMKVSYGEEWPSHETRLDKFVDKLDDLIQGMLDKTINRFMPEGQNKYIQIDHYDAWNMDSTLADIIYPLLIQLKKDKKSYNCWVDDCDVPVSIRNGHLSEYMHDCYGENEELCEEFHYLAEKKWDYVLDRMIWSFGQIINSNENYSESIEHYLLKKKNKDLILMHNKRVNDGIRYFGKYYRSLWS